MTTLLEIQGVLNETLPGVIRDRLPMVLAKHRSSSIQLFITTRTKQIEAERARRGNEFIPARDGEPAQFTWRGGGSCDAVVRRFRLEFLRHLGPSEMERPIYLSLMLSDGLGGAGAALATPAAPGPLAMTSPPEISLAPEPLAAPNGGQAQALAVPPAKGEREDEPARSAPNAPSASIIDAASPVQATEEDLESAEPETEQTTEPDLGDLFEITPIAGLGDVIQVPLATPSVPVSEKGSDANLAAAKAAAPAESSPATKEKHDFPKRGTGSSLPGNLYVDWFGFERMPFNNTPDPRFFFPTDKHQEALSRLIYAISERKGFVLISGEIGSGKSTLCRTLLSQLPGTVKTALITHTHVDSEQLVRAIAEDLDLDTTGLNKMEVLHAINAYLVQQLAEGATVVILIDEAQHLSPAALEEVRMISNLETTEEKLVQLILLGQPELRDKIRLPEMLQLRQRIAVQYHLMPLTKAETVEYIKHRLKVAAPSESIDFRRTAMVEAYRHTGGVPRLINIVCDNALLTAYTREKRTITARLIREAAKDLDLHASGGGIRAFFAAW